VFSFSNFSCIVSSVDNTVEPGFANNLVPPLDNVILSSLAADPAVDDPSDVSTVIAPMILASDNSMVGAGAAGVLVSDNSSLVNPLNSTLHSAAEWDSWFASSS